MGRSEPYTATVNYRKLAGYLRYLGYAKVPALEMVLGEARNMKDARLVEWVSEEAEKDSEQFVDLIDFWINFVSKRSGPVD
jgi:hypothetical protein